MVISVVVLKGREKSLLHPFFLKFVVISPFGVCCNISYFAFELHNAYGPITHLDKSFKEIMSAPHLWPLSRDHGMHIKSNSPVFCFAEAM